MKARELQSGKHFRVVGLSDSWEVLGVTPTSVMVRAVVGESRTFTTVSGDEVTIAFKPKAFYISRETSVEVDS